jgi:uncharacterized membrane protein YdjX (TVP38/TMEM64 family)
MKKTLLIAFLLALILAAHWFGVGKYMHLNVLVAQKEILQAFIATSFWRALLLYMLLYTGVVALSLPGALVLTLAGGLFFGAFIATPAIVIAATFGATLVFLFAQYTRMDIGKIGAAAAQFKQGFANNTFYYLLFLRLTPLFPFWLVNIAPALLGVKLRVFIVTTFIGIAPATAIFAFLGEGLNQAITDPTALLRKEIFFSLCGLGLLSLVPLLFKKGKRP